MSALKRPFSRPEPQIYRLFRLNKLFERVDFKPRSLYSINASLNPFDDTGFFRERRREVGTGHEHSFHFGEGFEPLRGKGSGGL